MTISTARHRIISSTTESHSTKCCTTSGTTEPYTTKFCTTSATTEPHTAKWSLATAARSPDTGKCCSTFATTELTQSTKWDEADVIILCFNKNARKIYEHTCNSFLLYVNAFSKADYCRIFSICIVVLWLNLILAEACGWIY